MPKELHVPKLLSAALLTLSLILLVNATACAGERASAGSDETTTLRLGYFPNLTHAQALIGVANGAFQAELGPAVKLVPKTFNAGPVEIDAIFAGELDAAFIGPNPAINGFVKSQGEALRIVAGGASGGALFIVRPGANISGASDLARKVIASPQLGGTQDVALRTFIAGAGLKTRENGGNVTVQPLANADTLTRFRQGDLDGAWAPEPWATRLVQEAGGRVLVDERSLWPDGRFATTNLVVSTAFLARHPEAVEGLIRGLVAVTQFVGERPQEARQLVNSEIERLTSVSLPTAVIEAAWTSIEFTWDPIAPSIRKSAADAFALGFLGARKPDFSTLIELGPLNRVLAERRLPAVAQ